MPFFLTDTLHYNLAKIDKELSAIYDSLSVSPHGSSVLLKHAILYFVAFLMTVTYLFFCEGSGNKLSVAFTMLFCLFGFYLHKILSASQMNENIVPM